MTKTEQKIQRQRAMDGRDPVAPFFNQWLASVGASLSALGHYPVVHDRHQNVKSLSVDKSPSPCESLWGKG